MFELNCSKTIHYNEFNFRDELVQNWKYDNYLSYNIKKLLSSIFFFYFESKVEMKGVQAQDNQLSEFCNGFIHTIGLIAQAKKAASVLARNDTQ